MKKIAPVLLASTILATSVSVKAGLILSGTFEGSIYEVYSEHNISWEDANVFALSQGGYLATLTTSAEDSFVTSLVQAANLREVWAGGFQSPGATDPDGDWNWVNGEGAFAYTNWTNGEPNDYYGSASEQHLGINWAGGTWNDEGGPGVRNIKGFVVESAIPEPSVIALFAAGLLGLGVVCRRKRT